VEEDNDLIVDVASMGSRVLVEELDRCGILPIDRIAHIFRAAIEVYLLFSSRKVEAV
jgi:hypothetical protein